MRFGWLLAILVLAALGGRAAAARADAMPRLIADGLSAGWGQTAFMGEESEQRGRAIEAADIKGR